MFKYCIYMSNLGIHPVPAPYECGRVVPAAAGGRPLGTLHPFRLATCCERMHVEQPASLSIFCLLRRARTFSARMAGKSNWYVAVPTTTKLNETSTDNVREHVRRKRISSRVWSTLA